MNITPKLSRTESVWLARLTRGARRFNDSRTCGNPPAVRRLVNRGLVVRQVRPLTGGTGLLRKIIGHAVTVSLTPAGVLAARGSARFTATPLDGPNAGKPFHFTGHLR